MFVVFAALCVGIVVFTVPTFKLKGAGPNILAGFVVFNGAIVLSSTAIALVQQLNPLGMLFAQLGVFLASAILYLRTNNFSVGWVGTLGRVQSYCFATIREFLVFPIWLRVFVGLIGGAYLLSFVLAAVSPSSIQDAMTYHLGRVGFWMQHQSLLPWETVNPRETSFPINSSLVHTWLIMGMGNDSLVQFVQWIAGLATIIGVYLIAGFTGANGEAAIFAASIWTAAPLVVLESSTTQTDLQVTALTLCAFFFCCRYLMEGGKGNLICGAIAIGLAAGTKLNFVLFFPGTALVLAVIWFRQKGEVRRRIVRHWVQPF